MGEERENERMGHGKYLTLKHPRTCFSAALTREQRQAGR
jgi:hypothetical protein